MLDPTPAPVIYCDDCGQPAVGRFQFFYANERAKDPKWSAAQFCCAFHKACREQAGHTSRVPE